MAKRFRHWRPSVGDKIKGVMLYFANPDGTHGGILRSDDGYYFLPNELWNDFLISKPEEGNEIEIELTLAGYRFHQLETLQESISR